MKACSLKGNSTNFHIGVGLQILWSRAAYVKTDQLHQMMILSSFVLLLHTLFLFFNPGAYITHIASWPLSNITVGNLSSSSGATKGSKDTKCFTFADMLSKTCKHILIC